MNYTFSKLVKNSDGSVKELVLKSPKTKIVLTTKKGHIHFKATWYFRLNRWTSVKANLTSFEAKVVAIFLYRQLTTSPLIREANLEPNYADIFGPLWT